MNQSHIREEQALAFRLDQHHLLERLPKGGLCLAAGACAIQNTPPGSAELALHARVADLAPGDYTRALEEEKCLLQAWSLRAAPHIFPTEDSTAFTLGLLPDDEESIRAFIFGVEPALDKIGISAVEMVQLTAEALQERLNQRAMTKDELGVELAEWIAPRLSGEQLNAWRMPSWYAAGQSLGESVVRFALPVVSLQGKCCHAERRGQKAYLMRTDQWLGHTVVEANPDLARAELVRRYLHCFGPSSTNHFAAWAGIGKAQAARAWKLVEHELVPLNFEGRETWLLEQDLKRIIAPPAPTGVRFLPPGDPYLALRDRSVLIPDKALHRLVWRTSGNPGVVLMNGQVTAMWRTEKKGQRLKITVETFTGLSPESHSLMEHEAESLALLRKCASVELIFMPAGT